MENYMEQVAEILGVKIGEEFKCAENGYTYKLTTQGIICPEHSSDYKIYGEILNAFLNGICTIKRKPYKPTKDSWFWAVKPNGKVAYLKWWDDYENYNLYKIGNCYETSADAAADVDKWISFYASDEVLEI